MKILDKKTLLKTIPFDVEELQIHFGNNQKPEDYYRLSAPDWINVLPITTTGHAVLIRQPRVGSGTIVLETPGGVMDPGERDPTLAASRELEEETGFTSQRFLPLGSINPNPAIMTNRCHFFLALGCLPAINRQKFPDHDEEIETVFYPAVELESLVRTGQVNHALGCLCIMLASRYVKISKELGVPQT